MGLAQTTPRIADKLFERTLFETQQRGLLARAPEGSLYRRSGSGSIRGGFNGRRRSVYTTAIALAQTANLADAVATVAMEYSVIAGGGPDRVVKFYAYAGGSASGTALDSADLDKSGPKFLPNLCLNCHGGDCGGAGSSVDLGSSFREFDVYSFRDSSGSNPDVANGIADVLAQEPSFLQQNDRVVNTSPAPAILDLIDAFYNSGASSTIDPNAVPVSWRAAATGNVSTEGLYLDFVAKGCRTCHIAQSPALSDSPHAPAVLGAYTGPSGWAAALGPCLP